jgi:transposase-like protein
MATRYPPEFRRRAVELARLHEKPILRIAQDLGISDATLHGWLGEVGLELIKEGQTIARYDSRDGFGSTRPRGCLHRGGCGDR